MSIDSNSLAVICNWIGDKSRVLDVACGDGELLAALQKKHQIIGYGLENDPEKITACISNGVNVIDHDLEYELAGFADQSFDTVVMTDSLQVMLRPDIVLNEMLRVGNQCIITFPNFGNIKNRFYLGLLGKMPVTKQLSHQWYDTPNVHFFTLKDFEQFCNKHHYKIESRKLIANSLLSKLAVKLLPNMFASTALYRISK